MKTNNVVIKKGCHSRGMLSGISLIRLRKQAKSFCLKTTLQKGDPHQKPLGMTPYFYKEEALNKGSFRAPLRYGFTLIELLVVVLIIGILAAVAVPQYQKAVLKSRYATLMAGVNAIAEAEELYFLENGNYTRNRADLDVSVESTCANPGLETEKAGCAEGISFGISSDYVIGSFTVGHITPLYHMVYFQHAQNTAGRRTCAVNIKYVSNQKYHQVCKSFGGNLDKSSGRTYDFN